MMRWNALRRSNWTATWAAAAVGLLSMEAGAIEEIVVVGHDRAPTPTEELHRDMKAYVEALNAEQKAKIDRELIRWRDKEIQIAARKLPTRG